MNMMGREQLAMEIDADLIHTSIALLAINDFESGKLNERWEPEFVQAFTLEIEKSPLTVEVLTVWVAAQEEMLALLESAEEMTEEQMIKAVELSEVSDHPLIRICS